MPMPYKQSCYEDITKRLELKMKTLMTGIEINTKT